MSFQSTRDQPQPRSIFRSWIQRAFKTLGLSAGFNLLAKIFGWPTIEEKKVVMQRSKLRATLHCVVHLVPTSAAIALLVLNGSNHYIGGELTGSVGQDSQKLSALLFAAKLHELFMLASLSAIVITWIRKELVFGHGVAFGAVFSASQFKDLTFLWSPELWGTVYHEWQRRHKKWFTISLLVTCSLIGLTVGPSTGILMRPRLDEWPAGGTSFWVNATEAMLYPVTIKASLDMKHCALDTGEPSCPAAGWRVFNEEYFPRWTNLGGMGAVPQALQMSGRSSLRQFILRTRNARSAASALLWANSFTLASVSPSIVSDALITLERYWINAAANADIGNFRFRQDVMFSTDALQPLVLTRCQRKVYVLGDAIDLAFPNFHNVTLSNGVGSAAQYGSVANFGELFYFDNGTINASIKKLLAASNRPSLYWTDNADILQGTNSSLAVVATVPESDADMSAYYACSIDSRFANVTLKASRDSITHVLGAPDGYDDYGTFQPANRPVKISAEWAEYLNPVISAFDEKNDTVFSTLASTAGLWTSEGTTDPEWFPIIVENILATLVANGIGRTNFNQTIQGNLVGLDDPSDPWSLGEWVRQILPKSGRLGYGGSAFDISETDKKNSPQFVLKVHILGYAYSPKGKTQVAAMTVLSIYVLLVLCHIGYSAVTGWYSSSWGSPSELTALAMNSDPTSKLENTGGGIETIGVFKENVKVRLKDGRAQMLFRDNGGGRMLIPGEPYA